LKIIYIPDIALHCLYVCTHYTIIICFKQFEKNQTWKKTNWYFARYKSRNCKL